MLEHSVVVELSKIFDFGNAALVELEVVLFKTKGNRLNHRIDDANDKLGVVSVEGAQQDRKEVNVAEFDLVWFGKNLVKYRDNLFKVR